jgi:hypothetical protein
MILNVTDPQLDQIMNALAMRPFNEVAPIIQELVGQIQRQKAGNLQGAGLNIGQGANGMDAAEQRSQ